MSELVTIVMEPREKTNGSGMNALRKSGFVPCVFYGPEVSESVLGKVDHVTIAKLLRGSHWETMRVTLRLPGGQEEMCLLREVQRHPLSGNILHIDFMRLLRGHKITINVPIVVVGQDKAPGVKDGGVVDQMRDVEIEATPASIPDAIRIDVSEMKINDVVRVKDIATEDYTILADAEESLVSIVPPRAEEEPAAAVATEEPKEVEVVAKGKAAKGEEE